MMDESPRTLRGTVVQVPTAVSHGLIAADGRQWPFALEGVWQSPVAPAPNQPVEFTTDAGGAVTRIVVVGAQQLAAEKLRQATSAAAEWAQGPGREKLNQAKGWAMSHPTVAKNPKAWAIGGGVVLVLLLAWLFGGGGEPSSGQIERAVQAELDRGLQMARSLGGGSVGDDMMPKLHDVRKLGCKASDDADAYNCDVEIDMTTPFTGRTKLTRNLRFVRKDGEWAVSGRFGF